MNKSVENYLRRELALKQIKRERKFKRKVFFTALLVFLNANIMKAVAPASYFKYEVATYNEITQAQLDELEEIQTQLIQEFPVGTYVKLTWWDDEAKSNSCTGKVQRIALNRIYGNWGDAPLIYKKNGMLSICSHKDYLELRDKEQKKIDRNNAHKKVDLHNHTLYNCDCVKEFAINNNISEEEVRKQWN